MKASLSQSSGIDDHHRQAARTGGDNMSEIVFNRYEKKFLLGQEQYGQMLQALEKYMVEDVYGRYTICNIYYDTDDDLLIRRSMQKPVYKEKLRIRSYGTPAADQTVYLEIKKKYRGLVNKRRIPLKLDEAYGFADSGIVPHVESKVEKQICAEIAFFLERYHLRRKLYLAYERHAFSGIEDPSFRVTFDSAIRSRRFSLGLENGSAGQRLLPDGLYLMEVKIDSAVPLWFSGLLDEFGIRKVSFSKYGNIYRKEHGAPLKWLAGSCLQRMPGKEVVC